MRKTLALAVVLVQAVLSISVLLTLKEVDNRFPMGCDHVLTLNDERSPLTKSQILNMLRSWGNQASSSIYLVRVPSGSFQNHRDLIAISGDDSMRKPRDIAWISWDIQGEVLPTSALGQSSLNAPYCTSGASSAELDMLKQRAAADQIEIQGVYALDVVQLYNRISGWTGSITATAASLFLLVGAFVASFASKDAKRQALFFGGGNWSQVWSTDLLRVAAVVGLPPAISCLLWAAFLAFRSRADLISTTSGLIVTQGLVVGVIIIIALVAIAAYARPRPSAFVKRRPLYGGYEPVANILRCLSVGLVVLCIPALSAGVAESRVAQSDTAQWTALSGMVTTRISPAVTQDGMASMQDRFGQTTWEQASRGDAVVSYTIPNDASAGGWGFGDSGGLVITDRQFLKRFGINQEDLHQSRSVVPAHLKKVILQSWSLWGAPGAATPTLLSLADSIPSILPSDGKLANTRRPIVLLVDDARSLNGEFLLSAASTGNVLYADAANLEKTLRDKGISTLVLSLDDASQAGLLESQLAMIRVAMRTIALVAVVGALLASCILYSWIYAERMKVRIFTEASSGRSSLQIARPAILKDAIIFLCVAGVASLVHLSARLSDITSLALGSGPLWLNVLSSFSCFVAAQVSLLSAIPRQFRHTLDRRG